MAQAREVRSAGHWLLGADLEVRAEIDEGLAVHEGVRADRDVVMEVPEMGAGMMLGGLTPTRGWVSLPAMANRLKQKLEYTTSDVDWAGSVLALPDERDVDALVRAMDATDNWRAVHRFPLNTFQTTLRWKARQVDARATVAQRLKRLYSIELKLRDKPWMKLSKMQDIGGCRAVVRSVKQVAALTMLYRESSLRHTLTRTVDYIYEPRPSGYRGMHLLYDYVSDRTSGYNGRRIEVQIRTAMQHVWATAVEMVGTFTEQSLKISRGSPGWLRFFALMASEIADQEKAPTVPGTPAKATERRRELRELAKELRVLVRLETFGEAAGTLPPKRKGDKYYLVVLNAETKRFEVTSYGANQLGSAQTELFRREREIHVQPNIDAVLVSVDSVDALIKAYPNYFLSTHLFLDIVKKAIA